jgi:hypothetical protein
MSLIHVSRRESEQLNTAGAPTENWKRIFFRIARMLTIVVIVAQGVSAQGSRKDDIVLGPSGHPISGATITVCQSTATGNPCSPLATIYMDATLTMTAPNPFNSDGIGNYHFYAPAGRYLLQITGPGISGTITYPDVILPPDVSSTSIGNNISAFGLNLGGNLTVAGNTTITGTLTTASFNPGILSPSSLQVGGNECAAGPRPDIDVTCPPYNAKGDNVTDDTAAITAAIDASCATTIYGQDNHPDVFFPPGMYHVAQTQSPSTSPDLPSCSGLHLVGGGFTGGGAQFITAPQTEILVIAGASPGIAPVFDIFYPQNGVTLENLTISAYNQAVWVSGAAEINFKNVCLSVSARGDTDNTPLKISNTFWVWYTGGCLNAGSGTLPVAILDGETTSGTVGAGLVYFQNVLASGGGFQYIAKAAQGVPSSNIVFRNITLENSDTDFFTVTDPGDVQFNTMAGVTFDHATFSDPVGSNQAIMNFNVPYSGAQLTGLSISYSGGATPIAVKMTAGTLGESFILSCSYGCSDQVVNGSLAPVSGATVSNLNGFDYLVNTNDATRLRSDPFSANVDYGPAARFTEAGASFAKMALDPAFGLLFNGGTYGFDSEVYQAASAPGTVDVGFASLMPPTNVAGTATTGGSLTPATYYYFIISCSNGSCTPPYSVPSVPSAGVVVGGSNNAVNLTWTAPQAASGTITDYLLFRCGSNNVGCINATADIVIAGTSSTTSYTDTGAGWGCCWPFPPATGGMTSAHRFTYDALGVNTTSPIPGTVTDAGGLITAKNTYSSAHTLSRTERVVYVTGTTTIQVPHALPASGLAQEWWVINSGSNTVTLECDSGNISGSASVTLAGSASGWVTADGTNCWEH